MGLGSIVLGEGTTGGCEGLLYRFLSGSLNALIISTILKMYDICVGIGLFSSFALGAQESFSLESCVLQF